MKKLLIMIMAAVVMLSSLTGTVLGAEADTVKEAPDIKIVMDGALTTYKNVPVSINGSNLLPLRELLVKLGVPNDDDHIIYNSEDKSITIIYGQTTILLKIGDNTAYVNGEPLTLNAAPILYKNSTYIPIRFVAEALGKKVVWDGKTRTVLVCDEARFDSIQQLLTKSNEAAAKVKKYKMSMKVTAETKTGAMKSTFSIMADSAVDKAGRKMSMEMLIKMFGIEFSSDSYFADKKAYSVNPLTGQWEMKTYTDKEYNEMFQSQANSNSIYVQDALCAGLSLAENTDDGDIVLKGDVYLADLYNSALAQQAGRFGSDPAEIANASGFDSYDLRMVLDKDTYLIKSLVMKVTADADAGNGVKEKTDIAVVLGYSDYDGDFEISVPEHVIKQAVEVKPNE